MFLKKEYLARLAKSSFSLVNNARTGIRTRVGASTGLHDRPLHYPDISVPFDAGFALVVSKP